MALGNCKYCNQVLREEDYDAHEATQHPRWALEMNKNLERIASALEGLERRELNRG